MKDTPVRSRAYAFFSDKDNKTHVRFTDIFHGGMLPGSGVFEQMVKTLFDVQEEDDFSFKMLGFNQQHFGYPDFKINTQPFNEFFGYHSGDDLISPLGSISDGNRDCSEIEVNVKNASTIDVELLFVINFASKDLYLEADDHALHYIPKWGRHKDGFYTVDGYRRNVAVVHKHKTLIGERSEVFNFSSLEHAASHNHLRGVLRRIGIK